MELPLMPTRPKQPAPARDASGDVQKTRYRIVQIPVRGTVWSVGDVVQYGGGAGVLRDVVICSKGAYDDTYIPVTLFNENASLVGEKRIGCDMSVMASLNSRQYVDKNGILRWAVQLTGDNVRVSNGTEHEKASDYTQTDEMPF